MGTKCHLPIEYGGTYIISFNFYYITIYFISLQFDFFFRKPQDVINMLLFSRMS